MNTIPVGTLPANITITPLTIPESIDAANAAEFIEFVLVRNAIYEEISGNADEAVSPEELLPHYDEDPDEIRYVWVIRDGERIIGRAGVDFPLEEGSKVGYWIVEILRSHFRQGIGTAAYALIEQTARENGRTVLESWAEHPNAEGPRLAPPTGFGEIPHDNVARYYQSLGYTLEQVERRSDFDLTAPMDRVRKLYEDAKAASSGYRIAQWLIPTPPEYVDGLAWVKSRMSTDAPAAALEHGEEIWDAERVARHEKRFLDAGNIMQITVAVHEETGEVAAFNELLRQVDPTQASSQNDTLVLKEHRGHRLGMLVKCAGILSWPEHAPESPKIMTYNAEENRPMLEINEALGFKPIVYIGAWKKVLT